MGRNQSEPIESMKINDNITDNSLVISDTFVDYYTDIPTTLQGSLSQSTDDFNTLISFNPNSFYFKPITPSEIIDTVHRLKNNSKTSEIPTKFVKLCLPYIADILAQIFNDSPFNFGHDMGSMEVQTET